MEADTGKRWIRRGVEEGGKLGLPQALVESPGKGGRLEGLSPAGNLLEGWGWDRGNCLRPHDIQRLRANGAGCTEYCYFFHGFILFQLIQTK